MALEFVNVKEELEFEVDVIEGPGEQSYIENEVKCELDIGPELMLAPSVSMVQDITEEDACVLTEQPIQDTVQCDIKLLSPCFVKLERLPLRKEFLEKLMKKKSRKIIFACEVCSCYMFKCRYQRRRHEVTHMKQLLRSNDENVAHFGFIMKDDDYTQIGYKTYTCDICLRQFIKEIDLSNHMQIHEELKNSKLSKENERKMREQLYPERNSIEFYGKYESQEEIPSFCISCGKVVRATLEGFARHLVPHMEENPVLKQILKDFSKRESQKSIRNEYDDILRQKVYNCPLCPYMFAKFVYYKRHMRVHTHKNQQCDICHKMLPSEEMLLQHKYEHNDNSFPPIKLEAYSQKKPSEVCSMEQPKLNIPSNHQPTRDPPNPAGVSEDNNWDKRDLKTNKDSFDFQTSSLFSRLKLLNQTLNSNVVGKSSDCPK